LIFDVLVFDFCVDCTLIQIRMPPPCLGQHTDSVLMDELGKTVAELKRLRDVGAIA
jgi:hypothetical protein